MGDEVAALPFFIIAVIRLVRGAPGSIGQPVVGFVECSDLVLFLLNPFDWLREWRCKAVLGGWWVGRIRCLC